jgi:glutamate racemase
LRTDALTTILKSYLKDIKKIDSLVLGCTHYPIIEKQIQKIVGPNTKLVNPGKLVVSEVKNYLTENNLLNDQSKTGKREFFVTDLNDRFVKVAEMFLGQKIKPDLKKVIL